MSTSNTAKGLPYPNGDDPVYLGDDRIKALALALDQTYLQLLAAANVSAATLPQDAKYPLGWSQLGPLSGAEQAAGGWPSGASLLLTHKGTPTIANQLMFRNSGVRTTLWARCGNSTSWGPWASLDNLGSPLGQAVGTVSVPIAGTPGSGSAGITFPVGAFAGAGPAVLATTTSFLFTASVSAVSATSATISARRVDGAAGAGTHPVVWVATQMP